MKHLKKFLLIFIVFVIAILPLTICSCKKDQINGPGGVSGTTEQAYIIDGEKITIGEYPQTISDILPETIKTGQFDEETGWYTYESQKYAIITAANQSNSENNIFSNEEPIVEGKEYAFKVEPIQWTMILNSSTGNNIGRLILADKILDKSIYYDYSTAIKDNGEYLIEDEVYVNSYYHSMVRSNLKNIYDLAFNSIEQKAIMNENIDNINTNGVKTIYSERQTDTEDPMFILSYAEFKTDKYKNYKVSMYLDESQNKSYRVKTVTDYAQAKGVGTYAHRYGNWWTRSTSDTSITVYSVNTVGSIVATNVSSKITGICPAMWLTRDNYVSNIQ